jgi:hypothetical protein
MGVKAWFAAYYVDDPKETLRKGPKLDRSAATELARTLLPKADFQEQADGNLNWLNPDDDEIYVGVYGDLKVVAHVQFAQDCPSHVKPHWLDPALGASIYVHATHSVVDWCAFGLWQNGVLQRALSLSSDTGILEEFGEKLAFERPFWDGSQAMDDGEDGYPFPFDPLELSEAALLAMIGFQFQGMPNAWVCDPEQIPIMRFKIAKMSKKPWWKVW